MEHLNQGIRVTQLKMSLDVLSDELHLRQQLDLNLVVSCLETLPQDVDYGAIESLKLSSLFFYILRNNTLMIAL